MTLPDERYRSLEQVERFLLALTDPKTTPRIPRQIRQSARSLLKHYPNHWHIEELSQARPDILQKEMEPVTRLLAQYALTRPK